MRLLYISGTYAPGAYAGSELSAHTLLRQLAVRHAVTVHVLTDARYTQGHGESHVYDGVPVTGVEHGLRRKAIPKVAADFAPDAILTQLLWSDIAIETAKLLGVPSILRLASVPTSIDLTRPDAILVSSLYARDWVQRQAHIASYLLPPAIDLTRVTANSNRQTRRFITMFNPVSVKGGKVFRAIAKALPEREFAVVPGWHSLRQGAGGFDRELISKAWDSQLGLADRFAHARAQRRSLIGLLPIRLQRLLGLAGIEFPEEVDFSSTPNVTVLEPRDAVGEIYAQTRLLLVPSQWDETFGRVAIEAFANAIPVIASPVGGLREHVGEGGVLVDDKSDIAGWVAAIEALDAPQQYERASRRGRQYAQTRYSLETTTRNFATLLERVTIASRSMARPSTKTQMTSDARLRILIPYFGTWPPWIECYLESCRWNPSIDWLLLTDCGQPPCNVPDNVHLEHMSVEEFLNFAAERMDIEIAWREPYKICDLRLGFGTIFREQVRDYDFFGWGDLDVVYGDLRRFLTTEMLEHDIVSFCADHLSGHLCLLRNSQRLRSCFQDFDGWRETMESNVYSHLDEPALATIPLKYRVHAAESFNTPLSPFIRWTDGSFDFPKTWFWRQGRLTNDKDGDREFPYLHFMHWKGGAWPRECGNAQWEALDRIVHLEAGRAGDGFRIDVQGFSALPASA